MDWVSEAYDTDGRAHAGGGTPVVNQLTRLLARAVLVAGLAVIVGWPTVATVRESWRAMNQSRDALAGSGMALDPATGTALLNDSRGWVRPIRLAGETIGLVLATEILAVPPGILLALLLFRTDVPGRKVILAFVALAAFVPLPLHATAWLGAFGNTGRSQAFGLPQFLVGRTGAAVVHALAALPWVVLIVGAGLCAVEPELEESALMDYGPVGVCLRVSLRRALGAIIAAALAVAVLTAGDMTVTDLLAIRTYAEESFLQYSLGRGPGEAAFVALPPLLVLGGLIVVVGRWLARLDPARAASRRLPERALAARPMARPGRRLAHGAGRQCARRAGLQPGLAGRPGRRSSDAGPRADVVACRAGRNPAVRPRKTSASRCKPAWCSRPSRPRSRSRWREHSRGRLADPRDGGSSRSSCSHSPWRRPAR